MKKYIADTNFYLRFILQDNKEQAQLTKKRLQQAKKGEIKILFADEVILEMEFVLRSVYSVDRKDITEDLLKLIKNDFVEIENRYLWMVSLGIYRDVKIDLLDIYLSVKANESGYEVLSYDKDFRKLERILKNKN